MELAQEVQNFIDERFPVVTKFGRKDEIMEGVKRQAEIAANLSKMEIGENFPDIPKEEIEEYLKASGTYNNCDRNHRNFTKMEALLIKELYARVKVLHEVLKVDGSSYKELIRATYAKKENAEVALFGEYKIRKEQLELIKEDNKLLKIPFLVRGKIMKIIEAAYQKETEFFEKKLFDFWER